jgi:hypothetical protein
MSTDDRSGERATAGFIDTGDPRDTARAQIFFVTKIAAHPAESLSTDFADFHRFYFSI